MIQVKVVNQGKQPLPQYKHPTDTGMDVRADIEQPVTLRSLERVLIPTGLRIKLPDGYECQVRPRSGLALKNGIEVHLGSVDENYTGEIGVIVFNLSKDNYTILPGERIAQLVFKPTTHAEWIEVEELEETDRGSSGYGASGRN